MNYEAFKQNWEEEHSVKCPYCGEDYTNDSEFFEDLITYHGEDNIRKKECSECERVFYVKEIVDRTFEVAKTLKDLTGYLEINPKDSQ